MEINAEIKDMVRCMARLPIGCLPDDYIEDTEYDVKGIEPVETQLPLPFATKESER